MQYMNGPEPVECDPQLIDLVLTTAITVHRSLGPGLLESIYQRVMERELQRLGLRVASQCPISVIWKGEDVGMGFRADLIVERSLLLELKAVQEIIPLHIAQAITYLKMTSIKRGFILNFNVPVMKKGIKRLSSVSAWSKSSSFFSKRSDRFFPCLRGQPALKYRVNFEGAITGINLLRAFRGLCGEILPLE
jgi:GxxExxY protein